MDTGGGTGIGGDVGTGGGDFAGRDFERGTVRNTVKVEVESLTDLRTDIYFLKRDVEEIKFNGWERKNQIEKLSGKVDMLEIRIAQRSTTPSLSLATIIISILVAVGFAVALILAGVYLGRLV